MIPVQVGQVCERGRVRPTNEDWLGGQVPQDPWWARAKGATFVIADGVGGQRAGHVAARLAVETVLWAYYRDPDQNVAAALERSVQAAHRYILQTGTMYPAYQGMATTIVATVIRGEELTVAHVGDSRAYLLRTGRLWPLTRDHTWVAEEVALGGLTVEQANRHPWRNLLTRSLGNPGSLHVDLTRLRLFPADTLLLCTDGLTDRVWEQEMAWVMRQANPAGASHRLVAMANARGGQDNITVIIVRYVGRPYAAHAMPATASSRRIGTTGMEGQRPGRAPTPGRGGFSSPSRPTEWSPLVLLAFSFVLAVIVMGVVMLTISLMVGAGG